MRTFEDFALESARKGEMINVSFERRMFELIGMLHRISRTLREAGIAHELVGGLAVYIHVEEADPKAGALTRDVDVMIRREDLGRVIETAEARGFRYRHTAGLDMLLPGESVRAAEAVHLLFASEKVKPSQLAANPDLHPQLKMVDGSEIFIIPVADLLVMKLSANRDKDRVHVRGLDAAGLVNGDAVQYLSAELRFRLEHIRSTE